MESSAERAETAPSRLLTPTDGELMSRTAEGDGEAFTALVERYQRPLVAYLGRLTGSRERAEDIAQEAFLRLYRVAGRYQDRDRLAAFLFRIATNLLRSEERRRRRWRLLAPLIAGDEAAEPIAARRVMESEFSLRLRGELARLPIGYRVPVVLFDLEGWSHADIARLLGCREGTVKSRIFRGRARLRAALAPWWNGGSS
jgi:RNA polymerase sigma factor (sigma-70 family)